MCFSKDSFVKHGMIWAYILDKENRFEEWRDKRLELKVELLKNL